jgi:predicted O-linked N-acetylglucosamine transferase (SPINDLY family)
MLDRLRTALLKRLDDVSSRLVDLESRPTDHDDLSPKGNALIREGKYAQAEVIFRDALAARPNDAKALVNLGFALKEQGRLVEARVFLKRAISLSKTDPQVYETHYLFGLIAEEQGYLEEASVSFGMALELKPDFELACRDLCRVLFWSGKTSMAQSVLQKGLQLNPDYADFHFYQGNLHVENQRSNLAEKCYLRALELGAVYADVYSALGAVQYQLGDEPAAQASFRHAQEMSPDARAEAQYQAACFCLRRGDYSNAINGFQAALGLRPDFLKAHSSLIFCLSFNPSVSPSYTEAAQRYGALLTGMSKSSIRPPKRPYRRGERPLRIGFVSGELKTHPVGFFLEGILQHIDRDRVDLIAYSSTSNGDQTTERLRSRFARWFDIKGLKDTAVAQQILADKIDILMDLGGHTGDNRLPVFALRPAPVQVSWLGYFASTGVAEIDYLLADRISVPEDHTEFFTEKICYLPDTRLCMTPPVTQREIPVTPPPAQANGHITFGSFQARTKINDRVLAVWGQVLASVPRSRLRLQIQQMDIPALRDELLLRMSLAGIDLERVSVTAGLPWEEYLAAYGNIDIVLDTFPYPGGTTTAEALWMGVPTVTLMGNTMLSRQGGCMLSCLELTDWIAHSESEYVATAIGHAKDLPGLTLLRAELRERALGSSLFDTRRFAANLQDCLEELFQRPVLTRPCSAG